MFTRRVGRVAAASVWERGAGIWKTPADRSVVTVGRLRPDSSRFPFFFFTSWHTELYDPHPPPRPCPLPPGLPRAGAPRAHQRACTVHTFPTTLPHTSTVASTTTTTRHLRHTPHAPYVLTSARPALSSPVAPQEPEPGCNGRRITLPRGKGTQHHTHTHTTLTTSPSSGTICGG